MAQNSNIPELSVSELSFSLKKTLEDSFGRVRVRGELSKVKIHSSGHMYSDLKDENSLINLVCWKTNVARLLVRPEEGLEVVCTGRITTYPSRSNYQLVVEQIELAGEGALLKMLEDRRKRLAAEGLFDASRRKKLPFLPDTIGVVTSPTGSVIRDILHRLEDRFPRRVLVWPVKVQGPGAAEEIAAAIKGFCCLPSCGDAPKPDLVIIARGGGSLEDLMPFNEEIVVRAAANCTIPLISAVGHETDTTLIDYVSDHRAPTPTAAAERAVPERLGLLGWLAESQNRSTAIITRALRSHRHEVNAATAHLKDPQRLLETHMQKLDRASDRLSHNLEREISRKRQNLTALSARLRDPLSMLRQKEQQFGRLVDQLGHCLDRAVSRKTHDFGQTVSRLTPPRRVIDKAAQALSFQDQHLGRLKSRIFERPERNVAQLSKMLEILSFKSILNRGFAVIRDTQGHLVSTKEQARNLPEFSVIFADGDVTARPEK